MWQNGYVPPLDTHWTQKNKRDWTAEEVEEFIMSNTGGRDVARPTGSRVLLMAYRPNDETDFRKSDEAKDNESDNKHVGKVLDFGPSAYNDKTRWDSETGQPAGGPFCYRGDWVSYNLYERRRFPLLEDQDITIFVVYDDQIITRVQQPEDFESTPRSM